MLRLEHVSKYYGSTKILNDINIQFPDYGLVTVLGESGSGKTTLLNIISGIDKLYSGKIIFNNKVIKKNSMQKLLLNNIGIVFQNYNLLENMSVLDNILIYNKSINEVDNLLKKLNIYDLKNALVSNLSGGEKQRVAIARALIKKPAILLCDEPTGALDSKNGIEIMKILKDISYSCLVIMVTHNQEYAQQYADQIIKLKDGNVQRNIVINKLFKKHINQNNSEINIANIVIKGYKARKKRIRLTILAFFIGLMSLTLVLGLSNGFKKAIEYEEQNSLSQSEILISEDSVNVENKLNSLTKENTSDIKVVDNFHKNIISTEYLDTIKKLTKNTDNIMYTYSVDNLLVSTFDQYKNLEKSIELEPSKCELSGNELLLIMNSNKEIDASLLKQINISKDKLNAKDLLNKEFVSNNNKYKIKCLATVKTDTPYDNIGGFVINKKYTKIPDIIRIFPKNYNNKKIILKELNKYPDIYYTDFASSIKSISLTIMNGISIVLIVFSIISLIVSLILISITTYVSILERKKEIGILFSMGTSIREMKFIFYIENFMIALKASIYSLIFVDVFSLVINKFIDKYVGLSDVIMLNIPIVFFIIILSFGITFISSYRPIKGIFKLNIIDVLKTN